MKAKQLLLTLALTLAATTAAWGQDPIVDYTYLPPGGSSAIPTSVNLAQRPIDTYQMNNATTIRLTGNWNEANLNALKTALKPEGNIDATNGILISADLSAVTLVGDIPNGFYGMFANCPNLSAITLPAAGTGQQVNFGRLFQGCSSVMGVNIEKFTQVTNLEYFMAGCNHMDMNYVTLPAGTAYQGVVSFAHAFEGCESLWGITNLEKFTRVSSFEYAFAGCIYLTGITLPAGTLYQGDVSFAHAFEYCSSLTSIVNLEKFTRASSFENVFSLCYALTDVTLPAGSSAAGGISFANAFYGCDRLTSIANLDKFPQASSFAEAFRGCYALQRLTLPASSTYAGAVSFEKAFYECSALTEIANLDKFRTAGSFRQAFFWCTALRHVSLPVSPANTQDVSFFQAFYGCTALRSVANLEGFTRLGSFFYAFRDCRNLTYVKFGAFPSGEEDGAPPAGDTFRNVNTNCLVYLPPGKTEADIPAEWKDTRWNAVNFIFVTEATMGLITIRTCTLRRDITLNGDAPFHCPEEVYAEGQSVSYTRDFGTEPSGIGGAAAGWETICLPFRPDEIVAVNAAGDSVRLQPFRGDGTYEGQGTPGVVPFWLRQLTPSGYGAADKIVNNIPYIIALPNNPAYDAKFNVTGKVTFRDSGDPSDAERLLLRNYYFDKEITATGADYTMRSTYDFVGASPSVYVVDEAGTAFVANGGEARPFRPYVTANDPQNAPAQFVIGEEGGEPTAIEVAVLMGHSNGGASGADGLRVYGSTERGALVVEAVASSTVDVVAIDGRVVRSVSLHEGVNVVNGLAAGVYVVGGCKAVVR